MSREAVIIIPARLNSGRLKEKALIDINGKPLIRHVYERCYQTGLKTYVATDSLEIAELFDNAIFTNEARNGSERVALAAEYLNLTNGDWIINVQGDKLVDPKSVEFLYNKLEFTNETYHTLYCMHEEYPGGVRVLVNNNEDALYFTRRRTPHSYHHCGIYAYTGAFLHRYLNWPSTWEHEEGLEQMRVLENGCRVKCFRYPNFSGVSVNDEESLRTARSVELSSEVQQAGVLRAV